MRQWWSDRPDSVPWTSGSVSLAVTAALFTTAFLAMRTVRVSDFDLPRRERGEQTMVELPPPPLPPPKVEPEPVLRRPAPIPTPTVTAPAAAIGTPTTVPVAPPTVPVAPVRVDPVVREPATDTTSGGNTPRENRGSLTKMVPMREIPSFAPEKAGTHAAPIAPVGVAVHNRELSPAARDSITEKRMETIPMLAERYKPTTQEKEELRQLNEPGLPQYGRAARMPGAPMSVPLMNGGYAVAMVGIRIPLPNYDRTAAQRIDADNQARLRRLQDRVALVRDSIRADSLKRDSLTRIRP